MSTYKVKEVFYTLQGEGFWAGTPAVFIRFAGCNMWSGHDRHRERDAERNGAECPKWCDTDFVGGEALFPSQVRNAIREELKKFDVPDGELPLIVLSGGEPLLQVDAHFCQELNEHFPSATISVETNGTIPLMVPHGRGGIEWVCVSPKQPVDKLKLTEGDELKVVFPAYDPNEYLSIEKNFTWNWVTAEATTTSVGKSLLSKDNLARAAEFCMKNTSWSLTVQTHKLIGIP
jgi:organic radical activating enzyme